MPDYTLATMRSAIDSSAFPPGASSMAQNNLINKCRELFYYTPIMDDTDVVWKGTEIALALKVYTNADGTTVLTLPRGVETLIGVSSECGPTIIQNQWFTYIRGNPRGMWAWGRGNVIHDLGDGFTGVVQWPVGGAKLQVQTTAVEAGSETLYISGTDVNGNPISETLAIPTGSGATASSVNTYYSILQTIKTATNANLIVNSLVGSTATFYALYQPGELIPNYRRYTYDNNQNFPTVRGICKRRYELLVADTDPCEISSVLAFESALRGYRWFQNQDMEAYRDAIKEAINYLNAELSRYQSDTESGAVGMVRQVSAGSMGNAY